MIYFAKIQKQSLSMHGTALFRCVQEEKYWMKSVTGSVISLITYVAFAIMLLTSETLSESFFSPRFQGHFSESRI